MLAFQEPGCGGSVTWWRFSGGRASSDLSAPSIGVTVSNYLCSAWFVPVDFVARISPASSRAWFAPVKRDGGPSFIVSSHRCIVSFSHLSSDRQLRKRTTNRATGIECRNMSSCTVNLLFNHTREMKLQWHCFIILYSVPHIRETRTRAHTRTHTHTHRERERERERESRSILRRTHLRALNVYETHWSFGGNRTMSPSCPLLLKGERERNTFIFVEVVAVARCRGHNAANHYSMLRP